MVLVCNFIRLPMMPGCRPSTAWTTNQIHDIYPHIHTPRAESLNMSTDLVRSTQQQLLPASNSLIPARPSRSLKRRAAQAAEDGIVAATHVQAAGYVTHEALTQVAMLSAQEAHVIAYTPAADPVQREAIAVRARSMVDAFTGVAANEIRRLG